MLRSGQLLESVITMPSLYILYTFHHTQSPLDYI